MKLQCLSLSVLMKQHERERGGSSREKTIDLLRALCTAGENVCSMRMERVNVHFQKTYKGKERDSKIR